MIVIPSKSQTVQEQEEEKVDLTKALSLDTSEELWDKFKNDATQYELSDRSNDSDNDIDENYDSLYFNKTEVLGDENGKVGKFNRRLITRKNKCIAKWAEDKKKVVDLVIYQQKALDPDAIFGKLRSDTVNLREVFGEKGRRFDIRGSSANWKNENWTPITPEQQFRKIERDQKDPVRNLDGRFVLSQMYDTLDEKLAKDEDSADDIIAIELSS